MEATAPVFVPRDQQIPPRNPPSDPTPVAHGEQRRNTPRGFHRGQNRPFRQGPHRAPVEQGSSGAEKPSRARDDVPRPKRPSNKRPKDTAVPDINGEAASTSSAVPQTAGSTMNNPRRRAPPKPQTDSSAPNSDADNRHPRPGGNRRAKFNSGLTDPKNSSTPASTTAPSNKYKSKSRAPDGPIGDDLASTLAHALATPPYSDCPICFSSIHPAQPTWSCSPSMPTIVGDDEVPQYCWTTFHLKCIRSWASKSVKDLADAWRARGEDRKGDWRCPGCQGKREEVPSGYWCFCHSTPEPKPPRLSVPHSCGGPCSRPRESGCGHSCPISCHPGPCPPCLVTTQLECYCPRKKILAFRCGIDHKVKGKVQRNLSCGEACGRPLGCGKHTCTKICHEGECDSCQVQETARCYCGKEQKEVRCGEGQPIECFVEGENPWIGRFSCDEICERFFDCGIHKCTKSCHSPSSKPDVCPRSPSKVTHCPCGQNTIAPLPSSDISQYTFPPRSSCSSPIPTCNSVCSKPHPSCSHPCSAKCHTGACPPCSVQIIRPCRCGATTRSIFCSEIHDGTSSEEKEILCDKPCTALRACGRHQCGRICCPLASLATAAKKGRKRVVEDGAAIGEEHGGLHECDLVCGKPLSCGTHRCEERDHRGVCPPCLRSSFEEMVCFCGRTVLEPPIPCGTQIQCNYPCPRPPPPCGHPLTVHSCHEESSKCPPCPFLTTRECACKKKMVHNVRCSSEKVSCGTVCGKLLSCGFHHCERLCHGDDCGSCSAPCGKSRKLCLPNHHPCTQPCHAPASCSESDQCHSLITLSCPCGRIRQSVHCGRSISTPSGSQQPSPKCSNDCLIAKRNARLADALGISGETRDKSNTATYNDELVGFGRANTKFLQMVEKAFSDFISSEKGIQVLPHMPPDRRKFVHDLASVYRMDTQMVDQEPHRSVQLIRRMDTRIPQPLLSSHLALSAPPNLGKLADLRSIKSGQSPSWRAAPTSSAKPTVNGNSNIASSSQRGWTSIVSGSAASTVPPPKPAPGAVGNTISNTNTTTRASTPTNYDSVRRPRPVASTPLPTVATETVPDNWEDDA